MTAACAVASSATAVQPSALLPVWHNSSDAPSQTRTPGARCKRAANGEKDTVAAHCDVNGVDRYRSLPRT